MQFGGTKYNPKVVVMTGIALLVMHLGNQTGAQAEDSVLQQNTTLTEERRAFEAELSNIQALAFGYNAICEDGDLKLRSDGSATFVISESLLCELKAQSQLSAKRRLFTLCSNSPAYRKRERAEGRQVIECSELQVDRLEI